MKKLNKKGFTLIELMAVVIVLIIVIFLAINKVNKTTKDARNNAVVANAGIYIKAVNNFLDIFELESDDDLDGTIPISYMNTLGIKLSGTVPDEGYVEIDDGELHGACLVYSGLAIKYNDGKLNDPEKGNCDFTLAHNFEYTGGVQTFKVPFDGIYSIKLWGAKGGNNSDVYGNGAFTYGNIELHRNDILYIYVGGKGGSTRAGVSEHINGGYNGGGYTNGQSCCDRTYGTGGGATDVRLVGGSWNDEESLKSRIMVAAGGGGGFNGSGGGYAGGLNGQDAQVHTTYGPGKGASQVSAGINPSDATANGSFGKGGENGNSGLSTGGGGGYYGGSGSYHISAAGGGSSYISGHNGCIAIDHDTTLPKDGCEVGTINLECSIHYSGRYFSDTIMKSGNDLMPTTDGLTFMTGNRTDGYAIITYVKEIEVNNNNNVYKFNFSGSSKAFNVPKSGTYKLEVWGAQGGDATSDFKGGYGAYSTGDIKLNEGDVLYINVGGKGNNRRSDSTEEVVGNGYNGGGNSVQQNNRYFGGGGGGATSIATSTGTLNSLSGNSSNVVIVAGGGGGAAYGPDNETSGVGGSAGGYIGSSGTNNGSRPVGQGGTQNSGGTGSTSNVHVVESGFGKGCEGETSYNAYTQVSGGGGYYGGGCGEHAGGGGGSGYIGYEKLNNAVMYCYNCSENSDNDKKTMSTTCVSDSPKENCAKIGNGFAMITYISDN